MPKWPKQLPFLTDKERRIKEDFMKYWHEVLPRKYGIVERFNHGYPVRHCRQGGHVLEIGAGLGEHIAYENLTNTEYYALELLPEMAQVIKERFPNVYVTVGDCQKRMNFPDKYFDRVLAIHILEHLPNLPAAIKEVRRVLKPDGEFCVLIPCEGGIAYSLARRISTKRLFEKRYNMSHGWCIKSEHINVPEDIFEELEQHFYISNKSFFPLKIPSVTLNLIIGIMLKPRKGDKALGE